MVTIYVPELDTPKLLTDLSPCNPNYVAPCLCSDTYSLMQRISHHRCGHIADVDMFSLQVQQILFHFCILHRHRHIISWSSYHYDHNVATFKIRISAKLYQERHVKPKENFHLKIRVHADSTGIHAVQGLKNLPHIRVLLHSCHSFNTSRLRQNSRPFANVAFKCISLKDNYWVLNKISLKCVPQDLILLYTITLYENV